MKLTKLLMLSVLVAACDEAPSVPPDDTTAQTTSATTTEADTSTTADDTSHAEDTSVPDDTSVATTEDTSVADTTVVEETTVADTVVEPDVVEPECSAADPCAPGLLCVEGVCICDETPTSFADDVQPLLTASCGASSCHTSATASVGQAGLNVNAAHSYADLVDVSSSQCKGANVRKRVAPGEVTGSYLMDKLQGRNMCSGVRMPKGKPAWSAEKLATVGRWICQGAQDN